LIEIPINDRDRAIGIGIVIGKYRDDDNPVGVAESFVTTVGGL
jgi:hypothetical protein